MALDRVALDRVALDRVTLLGGATVAAAGVGRVSPVLVALGAAAMLVGGVLLPAGHRNRWSRAAVALLLPLAASALLILMYRARHDPPLNQGNPATWRALVDLVARRQYDVQGMLPREAPLWLQAANVAQYADWQVALGWGRGIFTTPARVITTVAYLALAAVGWKSMRRESPRLALMLAVLLASGSAGVAVYLNLKAGASLGWGVIPASAPHEARERDYFFVLGFWAWGLLAGWGALAIARRRGWRRELSVAVAIVPLVANWGAVTRSREPQRTAARRFAVAVLGSVPRGALLFASGDNDTYPLWYVQQVEGVRRDVYLVTVPLLPAEWYQAEVARRTGLRWPAAEHVDGARWQHEEAAALIARAARDGGRVVAASPGLSLRERTLLGSAWTLDGAVYISHGKATGRVERAGIDTAAARRWVAARPPLAPRSREVSDVTESMLTLLECPRLGLPWGGSGAARDSLEVSCNLR